MKDSAFWIAKNGQEVHKGDLWSLHFSDGEIVSLFIVLRKLSNGYFEVFCIKQNCVQTFGFDVNPTHYRLESRVETNG